MRYFRARGSGTHPAKKRTSGFSIVTLTVTPDAAIAEKANKHRHNCIIALSFAATAPKPPARFGRKAKIIPITGAQPAAVEKARNQLIVGPTRGSANQAPPATLAPTLVPTLAQVSRNPTVRLNTSRRAVESGSGQK